MTSMVKKDMQTKSQVKTAEKLFKAAIKAEEDGKFEKAQLLYEQLIQTDKNLVAPQLRLAALLLDQHKYREAIKTARLIVKRYPKGVLTYSILGQCYVELRQFVQAEKIWRQYLAIKVTPQAYTYLGFTLSALSRIDEAISCYKNALKIDPNYEEAHYNLGCHYRLTSQYSLAEKHLRKAIGIDSKYALAQAELGAILLHKKNYKDAAQVLKKAIRLAPNDGWSRAYLANALWGLRKLKAADEQYRKLIEIWPSTSHSYWCYGSFLADEGKDKSLAESHLRKAVEIESDDLSNYYLGKYLAYWNREREAEKYLRKAMRLGHGRAAALVTELYSPRSKK